MCVFSHTQRKESARYSLEAAPRRATSRSAQQRRAHWRGHRSARGSGPLQLMQTQHHLLESQR
eukprot:5290346-Pyramimonas_sp.AAC.1